MTYPAEELINKAWNLSGIVSPGLQVVTGDQTNEGLYLLNALLAVKTASNRLIPYYTNYQLTTVVGQEKYFVPNLIQIETITFNIGVVRYSMFKRGRQWYFGSSRVDNINSLPFDWHPERTLGGMDFYVYFWPAGNYVINIWGKFSFQSVTLTTDLETVFDDYYIEYLRYALAKKIADEYDISLPAPVLDDLAEMEQTIVDISPMDVAAVKVSTLERGAGLNWGDINIGQGWRP